MSEFQTDSLRPSSLPTASLGRRQTSTANVHKDADEELDKVAEEWNLRIDKEMKNLTGGLGELVELADVRSLISSFPSFLQNPSFLLQGVISYFSVVRTMRIRETSSC
jgi:hypothetical protein